ASQTVLSENTIKLLERYMDRGETEAFRNAVGLELEEAFQTSKPAFVKTVFQLYLMLEPIAANAGIRLVADEQLWLKPDMVLGLDTPDKVMHFLIPIAERITQWKAADSGEEEALFIQAATQFIDDNYMYDLN